MKRKLGTTTGTKFAPTYACIFMDEVETEFLKSQELQPFLLASLHWRHIFNMDSWNTGPGFFP